MKEVWCEVFDELCNDFYEEHGREPDEDEKYEISKGVNDHICYWWEA